MNRQSLAEATSLHDGPVPVYLMEEAANATKASAREAEKVADFLVGRLNKANLNVKLKALQIISYCIREGGPAFAPAIREDEQEIAAYLQYTGPPDPVYGDEKYRRIRVAAQEALVCLNDGFLSRTTREEPPPAPAGGNSWQAPAPVAASGGNSWQAPAPNAGVGSNSWQSPAPGPGAGGEQNDRSANTYNPNQGRSSGPWGPSGNGGAGSASSSFRPPPYQDGPSQYGGSQPGGGYNAPSGPPDNYNNGAGSNSNEGGGYGYGGNDAGQGGYPPQQQQRQPSGLQSWAAAGAGGSASKSTGAGTWSSTGYQRKDPSTSSEPRYNAGSSRDNRPTVLVGHSLSFARPGGSGSYNPNVGGYNPNAGASGGYNPNAGRNNSSSSSSMGGGGGGGFGGNSNMGGGGGFGGSSTGGFGGNSGGNSGGFNSSNSSRPNFVENTSRMLSSVSQMGFPTNTQPLANMSTSKLGKRVEVLKRIGNEAREKWDRRNMDKSMASSLADHDELRAGPQVMDHGSYYQPTPPQVGAGDASRDYERGMIDNLCASVGLARAPPADALKRFVDLAQTLDSQTIGDILLDKLEDPTWQVRLKGLYVVLALLESPGADPYAAWFEDNVEVIEELRKDAKPSVVAKARQVLEALGFEVEREQRPTPARRQGSGGRASSQTAASPPPRQQKEVDFLGFDGLSIRETAAPAAPPAPVQAAPPAELNIFGSPQTGPSPAPPAPVPAQEISLLDGFDPLGSSVSSSHSHAASQQEYQQQEYQQQEYQQQQYQHQQYQHQHQQQFPPEAAGMYQEQAPVDPRTQTLSHLGKDLFTIANSPRGAVLVDGSATFVDSSATLVDNSATPDAGQSTFNPDSGQSAFNFM